MLDLRFSQERPGVLGFNTVSTGKVSY